MIKKAIIFILVLLPTNLSAQIEVKVTPLPFLSSACGITQIYTPDAKIKSMYLLNAPATVFGIQIKNERNLLLRTTWQLIDRYAEGSIVHPSIFKLTDFDYEKAQVKYIDYGKAKNSSRFQLVGAKAFALGEQGFCQLGLLSNITFRPIKPSGTILVKYNRYDILKEDDWFGDEIVVSEKFEAIQVVKYEQSHFSFNGGAWLAIGRNFGPLSFDIHLAFGRDFYEKFKFYKTRYSHKSVNSWIENYHQAGGFDLTFGGTLMYSITKI